MQATMVVKCRALQQSWHFMGILPNWFHGCSAKEHMSTSLEMPSNQVPIQKNMCVSHLPKPGTGRNLSKASMLWSWVGGTSGIEQRSWPKLASSW